MRTHPLLGRCLGNNLSRWPHLTRCDAPLFAVRQIHSFWSQPTNEFAHDQIAQDWQLRRRHRSFQCGDVTGPFSLVSMAGLLKMCFVVVRINCRGRLKLKNYSAQFRRSLCLCIGDLVNRTSTHFAHSLKHTHTHTLGREEEILLRPTVARR